MNILPHKSWHVRTKKNIARVREDERKAAEKEKDTKKRVQLADQEAKIKLLRERAKINKPLRVETQTSSQEQLPNEHINFFSAVEDGKYQSTAENADFVKEKKDEQEKYEKSIGYLTYLGQDTNEITRKKDWYEMLPDRIAKRKDEDGPKAEVNLKSKLLLDPLALIHKYVGSSSSVPKIETPEKKEPEMAKYESVLSESIKNYRLKKKKRKRSVSSSTSSKSSSKKHKHKSKKKREKSHKHSSSSSSSSDDEALRKLRQQQLETLRIERLNREKIEREKAENLLRKLRGETEPKEKQPEIKSYKQKYNSQFNPDIARQNID